MKTDSVLAGILIQETNSLGEITSGQFSGIGVAIPTTASKFAVGSLITCSGDAKTYFNSGTTALPVWNAVSDATVGEIALTTGSILLGAAGAGSALDAKGSGKILVGNGTTLVSVAVSGDATLSSAGAVAVSKLTVATNTLTAIASAATTTLPAGVVTSSTANLGANTGETLTITFTACTANSKVFALINAAGTGGSMSIVGATPSAGSFTLRTFNMSGAAMSSVYSVSFYVII